VAPYFPFEVAITFGTGGAAIAAKAGKLTKLTKVLDGIVPPEVITKIVTKVSGVLARLKSKLSVVKAVNLFGCFDGDTLCLITNPDSSFIDSEALSRVHGSDVAVVDSASEVLVKIKDVPLGSRVQTQNPNRDETQYDQANEGFSGWKQIAIEVRHANGSIVDVEILRSSEWIEENSLKIGEWFSFDLTDIDVDGRGLVKSINDGPDVSPGEGAVVIGRFMTREVTNRVRVTLADGTSIIGTANHPVWCVERHEWIGLGEFETGQNVKARQGNVEVTSVEFLPDAAPVYNLEVAGEHVYEITKLGVLVHNASWDCGEFLKLRTAVLEGEKLSPKNLSRYNELLKMVESKYETELGPQQLRKSKRLRRKECLPQVSTCTTFCPRREERSFIIEF